VGNLFYDITEADLQREFEKIAPVKKVTISFDRRGLSKGHGYVEFESIEDARRAIEQMNQQILEGRRMIVNYRAPIVAPRAPNYARSAEPSRTLYIGNMSYEMTDQDLNELFRDIRNVIDVRVAIDRRTGTPKGFAHADFTDVESAERAASILERKRIYGRQLRIDYSSSNKTQQPVGSEVDQSRGESAKDSL
jgi:RNA recognition motif-containing protein